MIDQNKAPDFWIELEGADPGFYWKNPWSGKKEKIASILWPTHPIEETDYIDALFASLELRVKIGMKP